MHQKVSCINYLLFKCQTLSCIEYSLGTKQYVMHRALIIYVLDSVMHRVFIMHQKVSCINCLLFKYLTVSCINCSVYNIYSFMQCSVMHRAFIMRECHAQIAQLSLDCVMIKAYFIHQKVSCMKGAIFKYQKLSYIDCSCALDSIIQRYSYALNSVMHSVHYAPNSVMHRVFIMH